MKPPLNDEIARAIEKHLVDAISHSELGDEVKRTPLVVHDPGPSEGKTRRLRSVLFWAVDHDVEAGREFIELLFARIRGGRGFGAVDEAGRDALRKAFKGAGCELTDEGEFRPLILNNLTDRELSQAIRAYVQRARAGESDAALVTGTGKDLIEAVAAHVCDETQGTLKHLRFPQRLGKAFRRLHMAYEGCAGSPSRAHAHDLERSMYTVACSVNRLRNTEGTGHGRPWPANVSVDEAKAATELMGVIAEYMLARYDEFRSK